MNTRALDEALLAVRQRRQALETLLAESGVTFDEQASERTYFHTECRRLKELKVAAIMDGFTLGNFRTECDLLELEGDKWQAQIDAFCPDLLFVESAWNGKNNSWYKKIANGSKDLLELTEYCRGRGVPVVFWNKEDPVYTDVFMSAASCADYVFTTDFDCIERYKRTLRHDNVYFLHFGAQPLIHEPTEIHDRKDQFCFAGAYYHRYRDRCRVFDDFARVIRQGKGLEIYDRNLGSARPEHAFPSQYKNEIVGTLKPDDIHIAYKGYNYNINMNSVGQSQTMFARRVFELLASNTVCVGNYARGCRDLFGDLTICTDSADRMRAMLDAYCGDENDYRRYRLLGLRKVLREHLCEDRLGRIAQLVFGVDMRRALPRVTILSDAKTQAEKDAVRANFDRQTYENKSLVFFDGTDVTIPADELVGVMTADDFYGESYLTDLALLTRCRPERGFGKNAYFTTEAGPDRSLPYRPCRTLDPRRSLFFGDAVRADASFVAGETARGDFYCADEFNYCMGGDNGACHDLYVPDQGVDPARIDALGARIRSEELSDDVLRLTPQELMGMVAGRLSGVDVRLEGCRLLVTSKRRPGKPVYIIFRRKFLPTEFFASDQVSVLFAGSGELDVEHHVSFYDGAMKKLDEAAAAGANAVTAALPAGTKFITLSIRVNGPGSWEYTGVTAGKGVDSDVVPFLSRSGTLVLADHYPAYDDLYRYMFVHKRLQRYKAHGLLTDMLSVNMYAQSRYREFEGIDVTEGNARRLESVLENGDCGTVCVHFLNRYLWSVLKNHLDDVRLVIWSHGSDIQPWERRKFNYKTAEEIAEAKRASDERMSLWREVFEAAETHDIKLVFVSEWFRSQVEEDYGVDLKKISRVIHNCIDSRMFTYEKKDPAQRFRVMSVKSFSSLVYANDLTQEAICLLSEAPEFRQMEFDLYGDGPRFEQDTAKLKKFANVRLHRGFLTQAEIAAAHKTHGIYIGTTRMDTQGVSRDEAMCSGLVPVANRVAAIPEFTDEDCCMLCPPEDARAVADAILALARDPERFCRMSENAAARVRRQCGEAQTIEREIALISGEDYK